MGLKRRSGRWMQHADERILEYLADHGSTTAYSISLEYESWTRSRVASRCEVLAKADFVAVERRCRMDDRFHITTDGRGYLDGRIDAQLRRSLPAPRPSYAVRPSRFAGVG